MLSDLIAIRDKVETLQFEYIPKKGAQNQAAPESGKKLKLCLMSKRQEEQLPDNLVVGG